MLAVERNSMERVTAELLLGMLFGKQHYQGINGYDEFSVYLVLGLYGRSRLVFILSALSSNEAYPEKRPQWGTLYGPWTLQAAKWSKNNISIL